MRRRHAGRNVNQRSFASAKLLVPPAGAPKNTYLPRRGQNRATVKSFRPRHGEIGWNNLRLAAVVVKDKVRFRRTVQVGSLLRQSDAAGNTKQQSDKCESLHGFSYWVTFNEMSSSTKEVCNDESSWPTKMTWIVCPAKEA